MEKENYGGNRLTQVHLEKWPLKRSACVCVCEDDGDDNWSCKTCKAPVISSPPINQHQAFFTGRMPFLLPNQQCLSTEGKVCKSQACLMLQKNSEALNMYSLVLIWLWNYSIVLYALLSLHFNAISG